MGRPRRKTALAFDHTLQSSEIDTCLLESLLDLDIPAVFLILVCYVSQGLRSDTETRDVAGGWAEFRQLWLKQMTCMAYVNTFMKYSTLLRRTPSSSPQHILLLSGDVHCGLKKKSAGCLFESGHYQFFNLQQVRKIPWPKPERVVAGKVRNTTWRKAPGRGGENIKTEARTPSSICGPTFPGLKITSTN